MTLQNQYQIPKDKIFSAYDTSFVTGDSPVTHDIKTTLVRGGIDGFIDNFGAGDLIYAVSSDGTTFNDDIYLPAGASDDLRSLSIDKIKITWVADTKYELRVV